MPTDVMKGIDSSLLVPDEEEIPSKHLDIAQLSQHSIRTWVGRSGLLPSSSSRQPSETVH